ncbi:hypothetical protein [Tropicimonas marinistellae]|uniref:hypothetical protein n=1 Tax=Tropicimonas marinistellae TaxID=1739787 RepID=UPI0008338B18|nr:hypothetical protein [Tropicimonas marinistellae]
MPNLKAILALYEAHTFFALTGALPDEAATAAWAERDVVIRHFLNPAERSEYDNGSRSLHAALQKKGDQRFRAWEHENPDISAVLRKRAEDKIFGPVSVRETETA